LLMTLRCVSLKLFAAPICSFRRRGNFFCIVRCDWNRLRFFTARWWPTKPAFALPNVTMHSACAPCANGAPRLSLCDCPGITKGL